MSLNSTKCSYVIAGTFNIYIFQPPWVAKILNLPDDEELQWQTDLSRPGFKIACKRHEAEVIVRPDKVVLTAVTQSKALEAAAISILEKLPETPLEAIGFNLEFEIPFQLLKDALKAQVFRQTDETFGEIRQAIAARCVKDAKVLNLSVSPSEKNGNVTVSSNVHFDIKSKDTKERVAVIQSCEEELIIVQNCIKKLWFEGSENDN